MSKQMKIIRVACYLRVSTIEQKQHGFSIPAQKATLDKYIEDHPEYQLIDYYIDDGVSADKLKKRTELQRLLNDVRSKKIDLIIFTKLDRWFRSVAKYYQIQSILDENNVTWLTTNEDYETVTANGKFKVNIMLSVAQQERDRTSERIKDVFNYKIQNLEPVSGSLPVGFKIETIDGKKRVVHDAEKEEMVKDIISHYMLVNNKMATCSYIYDKYGFRLTKDIIKSLFPSTLLYGQYKGINGYCEPYMTKDEWDKLQHSVTINIKEKKIKHIFLFSGLIICPCCGKKITGYYSKNISLKRYRCDRRCHYKDSRKCQMSKTVAESVIEKQLLDNINKYMNAYVIKCEVKEEDKPQINADAIKQQLDRLNELYIMGRIEQNVYESKYKDLSEKVVFKPVVKDYSKIKELIGTDFKSIYNGLERAEKQMFWRNLVKEIHIDTEYNITDIIFL